MSKIWHLKRSGNPEGPAILWLHGFMGSQADWLPIVENHFKDYDNLLVDLPGHGRSSISEKETFPTIANDLFRQIRSEGIEKFFIVGYSMGGRFGLHFQKRYPCHVAGIVAISTSPGLATQTERDARSLSDEQLIADLKRDGFNVFLRRWYQSPLFQNIGAHPELLARMLETRRSNDPDRLLLSLRLMGNGALYSLWEYLPEMDVPVLLLSGENDKKYSIINEEMAALIPGCQHRVIQSGDHAFHVENPLETAILIRNFLRNLNKGE